jgi:putative ABC transport system permease protein
VTVVNQEMAKRYFDGDAIGKRVRFGGRNSTAPWMTVVGVVGNVLNERLEGTPTPMLYRPMTQATNLSFAIVVRTPGDPVRLTQLMTDAVRREDPNVPTFAVRTMAEIQGAAMASRRFSMQLLGGFAALALLLATIGIYGVMSYLVTQRTREIGIRMALGARATTVVRMIGGRALALAGTGVVVGTGAALMAGRIVATKAEDLLFQVRPDDPATLASVAIALMCTALAAATIPARRAARVDPAVALRTE